MLKNLSRLEAKVNVQNGEQVVEKVFHFVCDIDSTLDHCKDALVQFMGFIANADAQAKANAAAQAELMKNITVTEGDAPPADPQTEPPAPQE